MTKNHECKSKYNLHEALQKVETLNVTLKRRNQAYILKTADNLDKTNAISRNFDVEG